MKYITALFLASAAMTSAQVVYNETTGTFLCPASAPNGTFCAGNSGSTNIIIRCHNGIGQPGNCNDNLAGQPPLGVNYSPCFESSSPAGNAACSKNCIVYPENGSAPFVLPKCAPIYSSTTTTTLSTVTQVTPPIITSYPTTTIIDTFPPYPPTTTLIPSGTGIPPPPTNGTVTTQSTRTPVGPTTSATQPPQFTGAADKNAVGGLAGVLALGALFMI